jgi:enoyl-CoA hydratase/carnithine racemase
MPLASPTPKLALTADGAIATVALDNPGPAQRRRPGDVAGPPAALRGTRGRPGREGGGAARGGEVAFSAGADLAEFETVRADAAGGRAHEAANEAAFWAVARCPNPVIAASRGACLGGGLGLALSCDVRIAVEDAVFGVPAGRLGIGYPSGAVRLVVAALGAANAKHLFFTAGYIDAAAVLRLGVVQQTVATDRFEGTASFVTETTVRSAPLTLRAAKAAIHEAAGLSAPSDPSAAGLADACFDSADYREGRRAYLGKREPRFTGS